MKRKLNEEHEIMNQKLQEIREIKQEKIIKVLNQIDASVSYLTQDEIALFIADIVVFKNNCYYSPRKNKKEKIQVLKKV